MAKSSKIIIVLLLVIIVLLSLKCFNIIGEKETSSTNEIAGITLISNESKSTIKQEEVESERIFFGGYRSYTVSKNIPNIELSNSEKNKYNLAYRITDVATGDILVESVVIAPGQYCYAEVYSYYQEAGLYEINIQALPFDSQGQEFNGINYNVEIKVI